MINFDAKDVRAVAAGTADRRTKLSVLTSMTCGEPCWHAREEVCRCSCGGRNHGCLTHSEGTRPERTSRIDGFVYRLKSVGRYAEIVAEACEINRLAGHSAIEKPTIVIDGIGCNFTEADAIAARQAGKEVWFSQYAYTWRTTDSGAPARLKTASKSQRSWQELSGWKDEPHVYLLWERMDKPQPSTVKVVDRETGLPLTDQLPKHCHA